MGRSKKKDPATRAAELREQAKEAAGHSGEALKVFGESTGSAAKDFAVVVREEAKRLIDSIEKAGKKIEPEPKHRGRKLLRRTILLGVGISILANDRTRNAISHAIHRAKGESEPPAVWRPESTPTSGNGDVRETQATTQP
jgi:hypothetical protein